MTESKLSPYFGKMLLEYLHGWEPGKEWYFVQHKEITSEGDERWWRETPVENLTHLIRVFKSLPPSDNYITATRYEDNSRDHSRPIYTRGWMDFDAHGSPLTDALRLLPQLREVQNNLRDEQGHSPIVIVFTGRGFHLWFYFDRAVSFDTVQHVRAVLTRRFALFPDPRVPIEPHRQMRVPGFTNLLTRPRLHAVWCTERMDIDEVRRAALSGEVRWDDVHPLSPERYMEFDDGEVELKENYESSATSLGQQKVAARVEFDGPILAALRAAAAEWSLRGLSVDEIALKLRRTRTDVTGLLADSGVS